jgi:glutathione S-transferase
MFAPVVARFHTYAIPTGREALAYMQAVVAQPAWVEWKTAAVKEAWVVAEDEVDWPTVSRI